jgi:hypothetical protein
MSQIKLKQYLRAPSPLVVYDEFGVPYRREGRAQRIGVIVSTGPGKMGFSILSPMENLEGSHRVEKEVSFEINGKPHKKTLSKRIKDWNSAKIWQFGTELAVDRAEEISRSEGPNPKIVHPAISKQIKEFQNRMKRYYK